MTLYVDPPEGWRYGFPKAVPKDREAEIISWMLEQGYPKALIDEWAVAHFPIRCWREEERT